MDGRNKTNMKKKPRAVIVPGSYDPVTLGHLDIIKRAASEYEEVYAVIFANPEKTYKFSLEDRVKMLILATDELDNCLVSYSNGLVIDYMREHGIGLIIKGYRNDADLEYEKRQAEWNLKHGGYDTLFLSADPALADISSTKAREQLANEGALDSILPKKVIDFLSKR